MNQQQFSEEETRLDAEAVRRVIDRAAQLQQAHLETVSADQLEALASEVGISPEFVRKALTEPVSTETKLVTVRRKVVRKKSPIAPLTARDIRVALTPGAVYALFAFFVMLGFNRSNNHSGAEIVFLLLQPAILTLFYAQKQPHRRMGALIGVGLGVLPILAGTLPNNYSMPPGVSFFYGPVLAALGFGATAARKWWDEHRAEEIVEEVVTQPAR